MLLHTNIRGKAVIATLASSGIRVVELLSLRVKDIDFSKRPIAVGCLSLPSFESVITKLPPSRMEITGVTRCLPVFRPTVVRRSAGIPRRCPILLPPLHRYTETCVRMNCLTIQPKTILFYSHFLDTAHRPSVGGSIPQLTVTLGVTRKYFPCPKLPSCSITSAVPLTLIPLGFHGVTVARSSMTIETLLFPLAMFLYLLVFKKISWLWLPIQKYFPSNSNPTGETSGVPLADAVAILASL